MFEKAVRRGGRTVKEATRSALRVACAAHANCCCTSRYRDWCQCRGVKAVTLWSGHREELLSKVKAERSARSGERQRARAAVTIQSAFR